MKIQSKGGTAGAASPIITKLEAALHEDGDFPVRTRVVTELRSLAANPNTSIDQITEIILHEPSLGTRILHLVNSSFYRRSAPIMTVSQAVVQIGMRGLTELCAGLVLMQRFIPSAQRGGIFADNLKKCILTSLLASALVGRLGSEEEAERGYLAGTFFSMGPLLLAYYFPQVYASASQRAEARRQSLTQSITETIGLSPVDLSIGIVKALAIPEYYREVLTKAQAFYRGESPEADSSAKAASESDCNLSKALAVSISLADAILETKQQSELLARLEEIAALYKLTQQDVTAVIREVPEVFRQHCKMIDTPFLTLPQHVSSFAEGNFEDESSLENLTAVRSDSFSAFVDEIRQAIANGESVSAVITSVMETLLFGLHYDRVLLLNASLSGDQLEGKMALGKPFGVNPKDIRRPIRGQKQTEYAPDIKAFLEGEVQIFGDPIFEDGWPFAAIPVGTGDEAFGVIYADKLESSSAEPLDSGAQLALGILAELLDAAVASS